MNESAKLRVPPAVVPYMSLALRALVPQVFRVLRTIVLYLPCALRAIVLHVSRASRALVSYMIPCCAYSRSSRASYFMCSRAIRALLPHAPLALHAVMSNVSVLNVPVPNVPGAQRALARFLTRALRVIMTYVSRFLCALVPHVPCVLLCSTCLLPCLSLCSPCLVFNVPCALCTIMLHELFFFLLHP